MIDTKRFLERLDSYFDRNDMLSVRLKTQALRDVAKEIYESNRK